MRAREAQENQWSPVSNALVRSACGHHGMPERAGAPRGDARDHRGARAARTAGLSRHDGNCRAAERLAARRSRSQRACARHKRARGVQCV